MASVNVVILEGRIAIKEERVQLREDYPGDANASCSFRFAVDKCRRSDGTCTSDFVTCVAFGHVAEYICNYCSRGTSLLVTARVSNNKSGGVEFLLDSAKIINAPGGTANAIR